MSDTLKVMVYIAVATMLLGWVITVVTALVLMIGGVVLGIFVGKDPVPHCPQW